MPILVRHVYALLLKIIIRRLQAAAVIVLTDFPEGDCLKQQLPDCIVLVLNLAVFDAAFIHMYSCVHRVTSFTGLRFNELTKHNKRVCSHLCVTSSKQ